MLAITSDYFQSEGDPQPYLKRIAEAGFSHIHWCHHWATDFLYSQHEVTQIERWFKEYGLQLLNAHASHGKEKYWVSQSEYQRLAGVELVQNRIHMARRLGGDVLIVHLPTTQPRQARAAWLMPIQKSLNELEPFARQHGVRLAVENMPGDDWEMLESILPNYDPEYLGLCYDSGHANLQGNDFSHLEKLKDRLIAVHLHDNDGTGDQHKLPFEGSVDWQALYKVIASSGYKNMVNLEVQLRESGYADEGEFLRAAYRAGEKLTAMLDERRMAA